MSDKGITLEGLAAAVDALRQELATWKALARKQDTLTAAQITATQSGATAAKIDQIAVNTAAIQALSAQVAGQISLEYVTTLPATGEPFTLYLVPQGDGTAPNYCNEYLWINGDWELIGTTGSMANNGELTIQVNGVAVGTFTANQAANSAINIAVPTNTNQLINGAQYVDATALATALALKQNNLNTAQLEAVNSGITSAGVQQITDNATAIAGKQDALTAAQQAAVDSGATAAKIDQIASNAAAIVSLASSKQDALSVTQLSAVNSGVTSSAVAQISTNAGNITALQTAVASKAADSEVVHLAGAEIITGDKKFQGYVYISKPSPPSTVTAVADCSLAFNQQSSLVFFQTRGSGNFKSYNTFLWSGYRNSNSPDRYGRIRLYRSMGVYGDTNEWTPDTSFSFIDFAIHYKFVNITENVQIINDGAENAIKPVTNNATDLGTSGSKWKSLNGIAPGKLSLPQDGAARIDISSAITNTSWGANLYTPPVDGWIAILINSGRCIIQQNGTYGMSAGTFDSTDIYDLRVFCPVIAGATYEIYVRGTVNEASLYPCFGNV